MEFFLAMDFLGCDSLRDSVEKRILERITKSNCSEVLTFVENRGRLCLEKIAEAAQSQLEDKLVTDEQQQVEQLYRTRQQFVYGAKTDTTTSGKLGRAVGFSTRESRAGVGFYTTLQVYCNWFVFDFTQLSVSISLLHP